jgi:uncharacterized damage-inducible protein DinB
MRVSDIRTLYDYNFWANRRILDAAARIPAELFSIAALGACKLRETLEHVMVAESMWRQRWEGSTPDRADFPAEFATIEDLIVRWRAEDQLLAAYLDTLSDADLDRPLTFARGQTSDTRTLWHLMIHVVTHGTQHRGEAALLLTELDCSPGDLDFTAFIRASERKEALDGE